MGDPVLYGLSRSVYTRIARLALEEKGVRYTLEEVEIFGPAGVPAAHLARQPFGRIPAFAHDGFALYETVAITRYVDEAFDGTRLQPQGAQQRARMSQAIGIVDSYCYRPMIWGVFFTRIVLRDIEVLRAPAGVGTAEKVTNASSDGAFSVMLKLTDTQVQKLHWVYTDAEQWHLELRPGRDGADSPENVESWYSVLREGVSRKQLDEAGADNVPAVGSETPGSESNE